MKRMAGVIVLLLAAATSGAQDQRPAVLRDIGFDQKLGGSVPLETPLVDEAGRDVRLGDYFRGRPVVLSLNYFDCPMLCTVSLNGLAGALSTLSFDAGKEFEIVTVSFDTRDTPAAARAKKDTFLKRYRRPGAAEGWHFLTGGAPAIDRLTKAVGFRYAWDEETKQFAHPSGVLVLTPDGRIARYLYGIEYAPNGLRLALVEASRGTIGTPLDQAVLYCFQYDPATGRYGAAILRIVRLGGALTVIALAAFVWIMLRRERAASRALPAAVTRLDHVP